MVCQVSCNILVQTAATKNLSTALAVEADPIDPEVIIRSVICFA